MVYKVITAVCPEGLNLGNFIINIRKCGEKLHWYNSRHWWCHFDGVSRKCDHSGSLWSAQDGECWWEGTSGFVETAGGGCQGSC